MVRRVVISGLGPVSSLGLGIEPTWQRMLRGETGLSLFTLHGESALPCRFAGQMHDFNVSPFVPKSYRKATKVMCRDITLAVAAAELAARDAGIRTRGTDPDAAPSYDPARVGAQIGAGLIAAEVEELTSALAEASTADRQLDLHRWGVEGMTHLTPLWLLKYLPNMLACHVTIIHDAQGPSNTITCNEAAAGLSIGESLRVIQRGAADLSFCGGAESKLNLAVFLRQYYTGRLNTRDTDLSTGVVRPFDATAAGTVLGEGGGIIILEALEAFERRQATQPEARAYAQVLGFGASQSVHLESRNTYPDPQGKGIASGIRAALREANLQPADIDLIVPLGLGETKYDAAEAAALKQVFGSRLGDIPVVSTKPYVGNCGAGAGGLDVCIAAKALHDQKVPAILHTKQPLDGLSGAAAAPARPKRIRHALTFSGGLGGQNAALVLGALHH